MKERNYSYPIVIDMLMRGEDNEITPVGYERMIIDTIEKHFANNEREDAEDRLMAKGIAWVILATNIEIKSHIGAEDKLYAKTWVVEKKGIIFRREVGIYREDGTLAAAAATFFVIIDTETRHILRKPEDHVDCGIEETEKLTEGKSRIKFDPEGFEAVEELKIRPSHIDAVGHVNNVRYLEMVYDALSEEERGCMAKLKRLESYFISELHRDDEVVLSRRSEEGGAMVAITKRGEDKPAFVAKLIFG